ncbi:MAG: NADH-quinone oxidoreductase subunit J [Actinomycetes bacterium]
MSDRSLLSPTGVDIVFALLAAVAITSAVAVVTTKQVVHAALWLVVSLGAVAGCYLVMTAEFVAWMQVLIYLGAVVVLLLFGMMLTRAPIGPSDDLTGANRLAALFAAVAVTAVLAVLVVDAFASTMIDVSGEVSTANVMGEALFRYWVLPFEALSVLLLSALVGAIALSKTDEEA